MKVFFKTCTNTNNTLLLAKLDFLFQTLSSAQYAKEVYVTLYDFGRHLDFLFVKDQSDSQHIRIHTSKLKEICLSIKDAKCESKSIFA